MSEVSSSLSTKTLRQIGGYCKLPDWGIIEVYGADAAQFLQGQTTNDLLSLAPFAGQQSCILDRKAKIVATFRIYRKHDSYRILAEKAQIPSILEHLQQYRFNDRVEFLDLSNTGIFMTLQGPRSRRALSTGLSAKTPITVLDHDLSD